MTAADYIVLAAYFAVMLWIGIRYAPYMKAFSTYFAGERALPWWVAGLSFFMSYVSSLSIVVYAGIGYQFGLVSLTLYWVTVPACLISTLLLARRWQRAVALTPIEFLEKRYHLLVRQLFAWTGVPLRIVDDGLKLLALAVFLSRGVGVPLDLTLIIIGGVVISYTLLGGVWAVSLTDAVQFIIMLIALGLLLGLAVADAGGIKSIVANAPPDFWKPLSGPYTIGFWVALALLTLMAFSSNWALIQRFYSTGSARAAKGAGLLATACFIFLPPIWIFAGMVARVLINGLSDPQFALAELAVKTLPSGVFGLMVAALMAAAMSTLSADYNVVASVLTVDFFQRFNIIRSPKLGWARLTTAIVGTVSIVIGLVVSHYGLAIFDVMVTVFGLLTAPMTLPLAAGLLTRKVGWRSAAGGYVAGLVAALAVILVKGRFSGYGFQTMAIFATSAATLAAMILIEGLTGKSAAEQERVSAFFAAMTETGVSANSPAPLPSPLVIAGTATGFIGAVVALVGLVWRENLTLIAGLVMGAIGILGWRRA